MKKLSAVILITACVLFFQSGYSQTDGTITFSVRTASNGGFYSPENVLAIWLETSSGTFVRTFKVRAANRIQQLYTWKVKSGLNTTDAITGSTLSNHTTHSVTWNCRNLSNVLMPDADYKIRVEYTEEHEQGPLAEYTFSKGTISQVINFPDQSYFKDAVLTYNALTSIAESGSAVHVTPFPNPFTESVTLNFQNDGSEKYVLHIFNTTGSLVFSGEFSQILNNRIYVFWNGKDSDGNECPEGTYFYNIVSGKNSYSGKLLRAK